MSVNLAARNELPIKMFHTEEASNMRRDLFNQLVDTVQKSTHVSVTVSDARHEHEESYVFTPGMNFDEFIDTVVTYND